MKQLQRMCHQPDQPVFYEIFSA